MPEWTDACTPFQDLAFMRLKRPVELVSAIGFQSVLNLFLDVFTLFRDQIAVQSG